MQIRPAQAEDLADPQAPEPQQHQDEPVPPAGRRLEQRLPLGLRGGVGPGSLRGPQPVPGTSPVTQPASFGAQLSSQEPVVGHLVEGSQHRAVHCPVGHRVLEELPDDRQHVVDPGRTRRTALASAGAFGRRAAQQQHEPAQVPGAVLQAPARAGAPAKEPGQLASIDPRGRLRPVTAEAKIEQEPVGDRDLDVLGVDHGPIPPAVAKLHPERPAARAPHNRTLLHVDDGMTPSCI